MDKREQAFWDYYNPIQELADKHDTSVYTIVNFRQIFDYAYACGKADGASEMLEIYKGENKHTHEIEVFGAPCLGGDYHEYCLKCGWVEPCEIDGESN